MSIIDGSYFRGELFLPNLDKFPVTGQDYGADINQAIEEYEDEILTDLLGYSLYSLLKADLNESGNPQSTRFINLINGSEFQNDFRFTKTLKWIGLKNSQKKSLIAYYVFFKYVERNFSKMSEVGDVMLKAENGERFDSFHKTTLAWENMQKLYGKIPAKYEDIYPEMVLCSEAPLFNDLSSAYNFLYANKETYPEWVFKPKWDVTIFGL